MSAKTILQIKNLDISFRTNAGVVHAIRGINLDLQKGETVAIVGESGSGKSVTMKAAVGLLDSNATINSGEILYTYDDGHGQDKTVDLLKLSKKQLRTEYNGQRLAMVFQDPMTSLDPTMTIGKQIMEGMLLHKHMPKDEARTKALQLLELVGITDAEKRFRNYPHQLSGGMRQRVVIAIALSAEPDILICDEPTTALDVTIQSKILDLIKQIQQKMHLSVIYITHDLGVVAKVADYVNVMYAGKSSKWAMWRKSSTSRAIPTHGVFCPPCRIWRRLMTACTPFRAVRPTSCMNRSAMPLPRATALPWSSTRRQNRRCSKFPKPITPPHGCSTRTHPPLRCRRN